MAKSELGDFSIGQTRRNFIFSITWWSGRWSIDGKSEKKMVRSEKHKEGEEYEEEKKEEEEKEEDIDQ